MTKYSLDVLPSEFWSSSLFHTDSNCCFLTFIQVSQEAANVVCYSHLFKNFPQFVVIHTVKDFSVVSESEVDVFSGIFFLYDPVDVGDLICGSSAFSKSILYMWKFLVHVLLKPSLKDFEHYLASMWNECSCMVIWTFFGIRMKTDLFQSCGDCWVFQMLPYWVQHLHSITF